MLCLISGRDVISLVCRSGEDSVGKRHRLMRLGKEGTHWFQFPSHFFFEYLCRTYCVLVPLQTLSVLGVQGP